VHRAHVADGASGTSTGCPSLSAGNGGDELMHCVQRMWWTAIVIDEDTGETIARQRQRQQVRARLAPLSAPTLCRFQRFDLCFVASEWPDLSCVHLPRTHKRGLHPSGAGCAQQACSLFTALAATLPCPLAAHALPSRPAILNHLAPSSHPHAAH